MSENFTARELDDEQWIDRTGGSEFTVSSGVAVALRRALRGTTVFAISTGRRVITTS